MNESAEVVYAMVSVPMMMTNLRHRFNSSFTCGIGMHTRSRCESPVVVEVVLLNVHSELHPLRGPHV